MCGAVTTMTAPAPALGQRFPGAGGAEIRLGIATPRDLRADELSIGRSLSADVDLGYLGRPWVRTIVGVHHFRTDIESEDATRGDASAFAVRAGLRADAFTASRTAASALAAVSLQTVRASVPEDPTTEGLLDGVYAGFTLGAGVRRALDRQARASLVAEVRRTFVPNLNHWAFEAGIRYLILGTGAYVSAPEPVPEPVDFADREEGADARARARDEERLRAEEEARAARDMRSGAEAEAARRELEEGRGQGPPRLGEALRGLDRVLVNIAGVTETERGLVVTLGSGVFASGQPSLTDQARGEIGRIAEILGAYPDRTILVEGHTDSVGAEEANRVLSEHRAAAVKAALVAYGVDAHRVSADGYGEGRPLTDNETPSGRASNRRVEIIVLNP